MRLLLVMKKDFMEMKRSLIIYALTIVSIVGGIVLLQTLFTQSSNYGEANQYYGFFNGFLFLGGAIFTSLLFSDDMFNRVRVHNFLMLPASQEEKFLSRALFSAILYPLSIIILFSITSLVVEFLLLIVVNDGVNVFNPFQKEVLLAIPSYFILSSLFFLGATYFKKTHFIKTAFTSWLILFSFAIIMIIFVRIILTPYFEQESFFYIRVSFLDTYNSIPKIIEVVGKFIYYILLPLFFYFISYLRIKEVQATDAIQ